MDRGFFITLNAVRRQLAAMPSEVYLVRLIHAHTRQAFPAEPLWTGFQLSRGGVVRFLRLRNREGFDLYLRPYADNRNAGYILLDLDRAAPDVLPRMRAQGHQPCVISQTSPGHLQAWVQVSETPLQPPVATAIGRHLARTYGGDWASTDWGHLGRLAGFTNQKPARRRPSGYALWVRLLYAQAQLATHGNALLHTAERSLPPCAPDCLDRRPEAAALTSGCDPAITPAAARDVYRRFLYRLRIPERFPQPDWSVADLWIAKALLRGRTPAEQVQAILRLGSPGFPRRHSQPEDYLARTLRRAARDGEHAPFPARCRAPGVPTRQQR
jgi:hypothetical protein